MNYVAHPIAIACHVAAAALGALPLARPACARPGIESARGPD